MKTQRVLFTCLEVNNSRTKFIVITARTLLFFALLIGMVACNEVTFDKPQPVDGEDLKSLENVLPGIYINSNNDTLIISANSVSLSICNADKLSAVLGKHVRVRRYGSGFVLNTVDSIGNKMFWIPFLFQPDGNMINVSYIDYKLEELSKLEQQVKEICECETLKNDRGECNKLVIKPKDLDEFDKLVKAGIFNHAITFRSTN